jgi:hypothetical protein
MRSPKAQGDTINIPELRLVDTESAGKGHPQSRSQLRAPDSDEKPDYSSSGLQRENLVIANHRLGLGDDLLQLESRELAGNPVHRLALYVMEISINIWTEDSCVLAVITPDGTSPSYVERHRVPADLIKLGITS